MFFETVPDERASNARVPPTTQTHTGDRVALICMPWVSLETPSIAMGVLKPIIQAAGFVPDLYFFNVRFAERIGLQLYQRIARTGLVQTEWFFSQALFGPQGTGELHNGWPHIRSDPGARALMDSFKNSVGLSELDCERLALEHVPAFIDECATTIDWSAYVAVGFTTMFAQSLSTLLMAKRIKQAHPGVSIVLGGANVDSEMGVETMRAFDWIDFVVHGEAEHSFPMLLRNLADGRPGERIPGVSLRQAGEVVRGDLTPSPMVQMSDVPAPDYSDFVQEMKLAGFWKKLPVSLWFESSRGCWWGAKHHCTFCGLNRDTMAFRKKDAEKVYREIVDLASTYRCFQLAATDNILANESFTDLLPRLAELDSDLELFYEVKANLRREQLKLMARAGIVSIQPGIESFNSRVLQLMRKGTTAIQNIQLLKWCRELGIRLTYGILYGFPLETPDDYQDLSATFRMLAHLPPPADLARVVVVRFSPYFNEQERFRLRYEPWPAYQYIYPTPRVEISKIAYFFHGTPVDQVAEPEDYISPAKAAHREWAAHAAKDKVFCYYEKGPGYVRVHDNRPRMPMGPVWPRTTDLDDHLSALFLFCDEHRSFQSILAMMKTRFGAETREDLVRTWLGDLIERWLMFREGDRYLTLPTRVARGRVPA